MHSIFYYSVTETCNNAGDVRLVGSTTDNMTEGRLEICVNELWGTVCNDGANGVFDRNAAKVACRQLGFPESGEYFEYDSYCRWPDPRIHSIREKRIHCAMKLPSQYSGHSFLTQSLSPLE